MNLKPREPNLASDVRRLLPVLALGVLVAVLGWALGRF